MSGPVPLCPLVTDLSAVACNAKEKGNAQYKISLDCIRRL